VIKIESPAGDPLRQWRLLHEGTSVWWQVQSRNKRSIALDLKDPQAQDIVRKLANESDVLIENFRPGAMEGWSLAPEHLLEANPRLIVLRVSGYGQTGPYRDRPGFGVVAEAMGGLRHLTAEPGRVPVRVGVSIGDTLASLYGVIGALLALHHHKVNGGKGQFIDVALYEAVFGVMESLIPEFSGFGHVRERSGASLPGIVPSSTYPCRDGKYVIVAGNADGIYRRLMHAIGRADLASDPRLAHNDGRAQHTELIDGAIGAWTRERDLSDVLAALVHADVPCGPIYTDADIHADAHYRARDMLERHALPDGTAIDFPGVVPRLSQTPGATRWLGPRLGEHTAEILASVGIDADKLEELREQGVV